MLVLWRVARGVRVSPRVDHAQYRCRGGSRRGGSGGKKSELGVREQQRIGPRGVRVEVHNVEAGEVAREEHVERVCSATSSMMNT